MSWNRWALTSYSRHVFILFHGYHVVLCSISQKATRRLSDFLRFTLHLWHKLFISTVLEIHFYPQKQITDLCGV
jgi:hypothetical protein